MKKHLLTLLLCTILGSGTSEAQTWAKFGTVSTTADLKAIQMLDENVGFVCGSDGYIGKTTNGGQSWTSQTSGVAIILRDIHFVDPLFGWAVGESGTILATSNGGTSWSAQSSGLGSALYGVKFFSQSKGYAVGATGKVLTTTNGGTFWNITGTFNPSIWGLSIVDANTVWAAGGFVNPSGPLVLKSTNGGASWSPQPNPNTTGLVNLNDIQFIDASNGYLCGMNGVIRKTTNGGNSWTILNTGTTLELLGMDFLDGQNGWAVGRQNQIIHTSNGTTWTSQFSGLTNNHSIWDVDFVNDSTGLAVTDSGIVIKYYPPVTSVPLTILQPNGGEVWTTGSAHSVIWLANGVSNIKIEYSKNNGGNWTTIAPNVAANLGSYSWNVPQNAVTLQALVRISDVSNAMTNATSNAVFTIINPAVGKDYAVLLSAAVQVIPPTIQLNWVNDPNSTQYVVDRKLPADTFWTQKAQLAGNVNSFSDTEVELGMAYEYRVKKTTPLITGFGYILSGIQIPAKEQRGTILLLVDSSFSQALQAEIKQWKMDAIGDGWKVISQSLLPTLTAAQVKTVVLNANNTTPGNIQSIFIIGNVTVPYSGNFAPDGHSERIGAQPADCYYGDVDGTWTDNITVVNSGQIYNPNIPGDGIWDQSQIPSKMELAVGRIDMHNMGGFALSETELLRQYLNRNHQYRHKMMGPNGRGFLNTSMDNSIPNVSAGAWRSYSTLLGSTNLTNMNTCFAGTGCTAFIDSLSAGNFTWTHVAGGGSDTSINTDVFTSRHCILKPIKSTFMQLYGSYFVEWNKGGLHLPNNLLRAPLASSGTTLATVWSGRAPFWYFHPMGLGETIGYCTQLSQNNKGLYDIGYMPAERGVHMALMGDPALRERLVAPVANLTAVQAGNQNDLSWTASPEAQSYHVYRSDHLLGDFIRITASPISQTGFQDVAPLIGNNVYMVRPLKLETSPSGSFYNLGTGVFANVSFITSVLKSEIEDSDFILYPNPSDGMVEVKTKTANPGTLEIRTIHGKIVFQSTLHSNLQKLDLSMLPKAVYLVKSGSQICKLVLE